jgi:hypothetical protein
VIHSAGSLEDINQRMLLFIIDFSAEKYTAVEDFDWLAKDFPSHSERSRWCKTGVVKGQIAQKPQKLRTFVPKPPSW